MGEVVVLSSDEGTMETMMSSRGKSSEVVRWEKYLPTTVLRVLLVESDDSTRQIITALLQKCSYKVVAVSDGLAAWETLKEKTHNIDLILTELDLPAISGFALLALVMEHEACKHIPVIMMSSQDSMKMVLKCMLRGAADYLIKPMRKNELKNLWQHVWRRLSLRGGDHTANGPHSLPASQQNVEENDETCADSKYHSDHGSGSQAISDDVKPVVEIEKKIESFDVTMDLIGGIDKRPYHEDNTREQQHVGPELGLSLKRSCSGRSLEKNQDESKHQKLISLSDASAFSRYENEKAAEKAVVVGVEGSSSGEPKTPSESHEKILRRCDQGSATTSSNHENIGSSSVTGQNQLSFRNQSLEHQKESAFAVESTSLKASKEVEVGCQSNNEEGRVTAGGESRSSSSTREKAKEEEGGECEGGVTAQQRRSEREAALMKFRMKKKDRCFGKKVRYESRKKLAEQRPRVKGQFVRAVNSSDASSTK